MDRDIVINRGDLHMIVHFDALPEMQISKYRRLLKLLFEVDTARNRSSNEQIKLWFAEKVNGARAEAVARLDEQGTEREKLRNMTADFESGMRRTENGVTYLRTKKEKAAARKQLKLQKRKTTEAEHAFRAAEKLYTDWKKRADLFAEYERMV